MSKKYVYLFDEGNSEMRALLGGKGANLAEMTNIGLPVPPGLTITTEACNEYYLQNEKMPEGLEEELAEKLKIVEERIGKNLGDQNNPLLVSVRSGAKISMPGMMDTILNLGLNDVTVEGMAAATENRRFAMDCYRRFIQMFGDVAMGVNSELFENALADLKIDENVKYDHQLSAEALEKLIETFKGIYKKATGSDFPQDPKEQLLLAVQAVFRSWNSDRAIYYRKHNKIPDDLGTAVNVQCMVFGNMGDDCGTGVAFTRNPSTGEKGLYGEYLINAQGEDVVAGIRTPEPITSLERDMPEVYKQFLNISQLLEKHYHDMQDMEFTVERGKLFMLQTRNGKRTAAAAVKAAVDMVDEGLIDKETALMRLEPLQINQLLHPGIDPNAKLDEIAHGLPASPGAACGQVVFDADTAEELGKAGKKVILVRTETTPEDIHGMNEAQGILTSHGGMTSHAAVIARGMGKPAVCGAEALKIDAVGKKVQIGNETFTEADTLSIDGATGRIFKGEVPMTSSAMGKEFQTFLGWADDVKRLDVRANADTPEDAQKARDFGAKGIGLTRTEHMFMAQDRLPVVQEMILADDVAGREAALAKLLPMQREDFYGILKVMAGFPVTIRLLDPPLHEFLPSKEELLVEITKLKCLNGDKEEIAEKEALLKRVEHLSEFNPMLGHRGCRLGITYPEIYAMQARAIFEAVAQLTKEGYEVEPEVEVPLIIHINEFKRLKDLINGVGDAVKEETGVDFSYTVGTMIEVPRAALTTDQLAKEAQFFSFGTNDLTQTTFGFSRDDAEGKFLHTYVDQKVLPVSPFVTLDESGVGKLMDMAIKAAREVDPDFLIGICGEHGGDPESIELCHRLGLNFVSCSPYRVPIARLAAAQAAIQNK
ncbi:MAG TPA: pyruvate, phosphate dikinase [Firmicutes bacterium]|nr:pyruvate, phosphate dikinase [Bacillota bacterium]